LKKQLRQVMTEFENYKATAPSTTTAIVAAAPHPPSSSAEQPPKH